MSDDRKLCSLCVADGPLRQWLEENGIEDTCDFDPTHESAPCVTVDEFAEEADRWFTENYQPGAETWAVDPDPDRDGVIYGTEGEPFEDIFAYELEASGDVLRAVIDALPDVSDHDVAQGADRFYTDAHNFESIEAARAREKADQDEYWFANRYTFQWEDFCENVKFSARFFGTKERLDELFGEPAEYGEGPVRPLYDLPEGHPIFRARLLNDDLSEDVINQDPAARLGAPPSNRTQSGRMNVEFIPAFYAAFSPETAISELRPGIGDELAVGQFRTRKALRVFDFTVFHRRANDRPRLVMHNRYEFITQMQAQISKPVRPHERQREYIATQIVAEYLKTYFGCDAVIYRSSMQRDQDGEDRNIVILNREAFVGTNDAVLAYVGWSLKEVRDVRYTIADGLIF
jgi:hypothetical protein